MYQDQEMNGAGGEEPVIIATFPASRFPATAAAIGKLGLVERCSMSCLFSNLLLC